MSAMTRDIREIIREEPVMRGRILALLQDGPRTVPEIATAIDCPSHEVVFWIMGMRRYGWVHELKESEVEGYFSYALTERPS
jgi:predicted transcriptional regulator